MNGFSFHRLSIGSVLTCGFEVKRYTDEPAERSPGILLF